MTVTEQIQALKKEKNAVILAHYYVGDEIQAVADEVGDSYYLSKVAAQTDADRIVFCGVSFMGESAKIMNPGKRVFMPDLTADCAMAHMVDFDFVKKTRETYEDLAVVCYINSTAKIKTCSDVCVTSANAVRIVQNLPNQHILFIPDGNLGRYVAEQVPQKHVILNQGYCPVHQAFTSEQVKKAKTEHPEAEFVVHPECPMEVLEEASYIGSTSGIINYISQSEKQEFLIGTELGVLYELQKENPEKRFYAVKEDQYCADMKKNSLAKLLKVLEEDCNEVFVEKTLAKDAMKPLERMLELAESVKA